MASGQKTDAQILENKWCMLPHLLKLRGLLKNQTASFDYFLDQELGKILQANKEVRTDEVPGFSLEYLNIRIGQPSANVEGLTTKLTPQICRLRDMTYSAPAFVDFVLNIRDKNPIIIRDQQLCYIPIMLKSNYCILSGKTEADLVKLGECPLDPGGYFVIKGTERVILIQEQMSKNRIIIEKSSKGEIQGTSTSSTHERKSKTDIITKHGKYYLHHSTLSDDIPIVVAMRAMNAESDQDIIAMVGIEPTFTHAMMSSFEEASMLGIWNQQQALEWIGTHIRMMRTNSFRTRSDEARELLSSVVFPHVPTGINFNYRPKALFIGSILRKMIIASIDPNEFDDKDYYGNKRLELAGQLLALLFEDHFKRFNDEVKRNVEQFYRKKNNSFGLDAKKLFLGSSSITNGFVYALSTGNWTLKRFHMDRQGVTQVLSRLSFISCMGMMTRLSSQFEKTRKISGPRSLQPSQFGMICPSDTPEGESCGLVKNFALLTHVTTDEEIAPIINVLFTLGVQSIDSLSPLEIHKHPHVVANGVDLGIHRNPAWLVKVLRKLRRAGRIGEFVSVFYDSGFQIQSNLYGESPHSSGPIAKGGSGNFGTKSGRKIVNISADSGRVCRPLIIIKEDGTSSLQAQQIRELYLGRRNFADCLREGLLEYIDVNEENNCDIALYEKDIVPGRTTHLEIDCLSILGICAGLIPYPHHNQSPRNTYQCAMGKQAMGQICYNQNQRIDTVLYTLVSPQRPLVKTRVIDLIGFNNLPAGMNAIVGVVSYSGYDIEDAIILNKASLDRGFARCIVYRKQTTSIRIYPNQYSDIIGTPPVNQTPHHDRYQALGKDGLVAPGERLEPNDVWCNKFIPKNTSQNINNTQMFTINDYIQSSQTFKGATPVIVDQVLITSNQDFPVIIKISTRDVRRPELGDKFSSRHGQKGVCGMIVPQEDMPFTDQGICPDLIMNPHGYPSRMTVGKLIELVAGKAAVNEGTFRDGTAFKGDSVKEVCESLVRRGFSYDGKDHLTSGITGEPLEAFIFFGPLYYQKLKHMVVDKMHARSRGPKAMLTRQPTEGRSRDGGLRLGEMEKDCLVGYGASLLLLERLMLSSDVFYISDTRIGASTAGRRPTYDL